MAGGPWTISGGHVPPVPLKRRARRSYPGARSLSVCGERPKSKSSKFIVRFSPSANRWRKGLILFAILQRLFLCPSGCPSRFARDLFCGSLSHVISTQLRSLRSFSRIVGDRCAPGRRPEGPSRA
jgi:hypothetical protein